MAASILRKNIYELNVCLCVCVIGHKILGGIKLSSIWVSGEMGNTVGTLSHYYCFEIHSEFFANSYQIVQMIFCKRKGKAILLSPIQFYVAVLGYTKMELS